MPSNWNLADRIIDCFSDVIGFDETGDMDTLQKKLMHIQRQKWNGRLSDIRVCSEVPMPLAKKKGNFTK
ncbi:MAG: hypothetical protein OXG97_10165 [Candidatus Poribacteria bacterium]|nr:hypothetical protein [Candidatus Poribacteria bacterium]